MSKLFAPDGAVCRNCGLPLAFEQLPSGKWCPRNPDGSDHWDLCRATRIAAMTPNQRAAQAERDRIIGAPRRTRGFRGALVYNGELPPWDESLGTYRKFTKDEKKDRSVCQRVLD